jgi:hypothetical protein
MELTRPQAPGDRFVNDQNVGQLLVIEVLEPVYGVQTENGPADAIRANVFTVQPPGVIGASYLGTLLFGKVLFSRLVQSQGKAVVGILSGQPGVKVAGKNVPYDLEDPSDAMMEAAARAMMTRPQQAAQPATAQQAPQAGPWGQQPAAQGGGPWGTPPNVYGQPPAQQPAAAAGPWGQSPAPDQSWGQQQLPQPPAPQQGPPPGWGAPPAQSDLPPWEQQPAAPPWAGGQQ